MFSKLKMPEKSLFAILLRSPWWMSYGIALAIGLIGRVVVSEEHYSYALAFTLPFVAIGTIAAWRQKDVPSEGRVEDTVEAVSAMSWQEFSGLMEKAFQRDGFTVTRIKGRADFLIEKEGRPSVVCCKRWKAASQGIEPLRDLDAERDAREAREALYVSIVEPSEAARRYAKENRIALMLAPQLTRLLRLPKKPLQRK